MQCELAIVKTTLPQLPKDAQNAWLEIETAICRGTLSIEIGYELIVIA